MDGKNGCRWRTGLLCLLAAGLLACCVPLTALASEGDRAGIEKMSVRQAGLRADETDKSGGLDFEWLYQVPKTKTVYTAGSGRMTWTPEMSGNQVVGGTLVLKDAVINNSGGMGINFPVPITIKVEGENRITSSSMGICLLNKETGNPAKLQIEGSGSLMINSQGHGIQASGGVSVDTVRLEILYGSQGKICSGVYGTTGDVVIQNCEWVKVKNNPGIGTNSGAIVSSQSGNGTVRIENSHVVIMNEGGAAIAPPSGRIELLSSDVRAIGNTSSSGASGTLSFAKFEMDGGTLYADNKGSDNEIPLVFDHRVTMKNGAVLYGARSNYVLPLEGDCVWYIGCGYNENTDTVTVPGSGYVFGEVVWNENLYLKEGKALAIGTYSQEKSSLIIPRVMTVDMPAGSKIRVVYSENGAESEFVIEGTLHVGTKCEVICDNKSTIVNKGTLDVYKEGVFQNQNRLENSGTINIEGNFSSILLTGYDAAIVNTGVINGFIIEMYDDRYVNVASGKTVLSGTTLTLGKSVSADGKKDRILKVPDGAGLTVEKGGIIDAKTNVTMDTVSDYIDLSDTIVVNGELWLPEDTPEEVLAQIADKVIGNGSIVTGNAKKCIVSIDIGGQSKTQFVEQGGTVNLAEKPVRDGYNFAGWYVKEGGGLKPFDLTTPVKQSMEIISKWVGVNKWVTPLAIKGWVYGEKANGPKAEPRFGKVYYRYGKNVDEKFTGTVPSEAGTWYVKAYVDGTEEYTSMESSAVSFRIDPKAYKEGGSIVISAVSNAETVKNLVIKDGAKELVKGKDYTVTTVESGNKVIVTVTFQGNYSGSATREYPVAGSNPAEPEKPAQPEKPTQPEKPAEPKMDVTGNTVLLNNKAKAVFSGTKIKVTWGRVSKATGYDVYAEQCGKTIKLIKTVKGSKNTAYTVKKIGKKKISSKKNYKIKIRAYRTVKGKKQVIGSSLTLHVVGKNKKGYTNARSMKVSVSKFTVKKGATKKIKAMAVKQDAKKKLLPKKHVATYRYYSTNKSIATVSASGKVKGRKKGVCTVYAVAANGVKKGVKVTVK